MKQQIELAQVKYDPAQNFLLKRNPFVLQKKLWETWG